MRVKSRFCGITNRRAMLAVDAILAVGLTMLLAAMFSAAVLQYGRSVRLDDVRTELRHAAEAELLRLRTTGIDTTARSSPTSQTASEDVNKLLLETDFTTGEGDWQGMTLVRIRASRCMEGGRISVELSAYLPATEDLP